MASWRKRAALGLAVIPLALGASAPGTALAGAGGDDGLYDGDQAPKDVENRHALRMYKVEQHLDLEEIDYATVRVTCSDDRDLAADGMWRIDHVDVDGSGIAPLGDIDVYAAYTDPADPASYIFEIYNNSEGRAQMKLFLTCLGHDTHEGHQHRWQLRTPAVRQATFVRGSGQQAFGSAPKECGKNEIAVSPGFQWTRGYGEIYKSHAATAALRGWDWGFFVALVDESDGNAEVAVSLRCLKLRSTTANSHHHLIQPAFRPYFPENLTQIPAGQTQTRTRTCGLHEKAMVHSFDLDPSPYGEQIWYLGNDPRMKARAYRIKNVLSWDVWVKFGAVCFNDRTSRKL